MNFKNWINEYGTQDDPRIGLRGLFRSTCGNKSCSRGSSSWLPDFDTNTATPNFKQIPLDFGKNTNGYYDENTNRFSLVVEISQILQDKNKNSLIGQLIQKSRENIEIINKNKLLGFINNKVNLTQNRSGSENNKFNELKYFKNYIAKDSLIIVYQLI